MTARELYRHERDKRRNGLAALIARAVALECDALDRQSRYPRLKLSVRDAHRRRLVALRRALVR